MTKVIEAKRVIQVNGDLLDPLVSAVLLEHLDSLASEAVTAFLDRPDLLANAEHLVLRVQVESRGRPGRPRKPRPKSSD